MQRIASLDVYRGIVMFLVGMRLLLLDEVALLFPDSAVWRFIGFHSSHVPWAGCSLNDLIHPSFAFLTGVSLVFSVTSRAAKGQTLRSMTLHALWRALVLIVLGIFIRSIGRPMTNWTFDETLTQTGLGYMAVFVLAFAGAKVRWSAFAAILLGYWLFYVLAPVTGGEPFSGFFAHWNRNSNAGHTFDVWLLNLFPRRVTYTGWLGGYTTLNFIPTICTMILGLMAGTWLKQAGTATKQLLIAGAACLAIAFALHFGGVCPIVKRLWTPAWVFLSGGLCFLILATLYQLVDVNKHQRWAFTFIVIGMNSLAMYLMRHFLEDFLAESLQRHLGTRLFQVFGSELQPAMIGACSLLILWLILLWLYRRKIFLRL